MARDAADSAGTGHALPVILACAVFQGWALYGLHHAVVAEHWPATRPAWLLAFYAVAVFVPLTVQMLAEHARARTLRIVVAMLSLAFLGFGWHDGGFVYTAGDERGPFGRLVPLLFVVALLWLQLLPFVQGRLATGRWHCGYPVLFTKAWRNKLTLAEAGLFTVLFWLLLFLWQKLFDLLGIGFFRELFAEPVFVYPVTALTFGIALHLIGAIENLTLAILDQLLSVLKWLAVVGGFILVIFSAALLVKLPGLVATGERAIGAQWLLCLVAVMVLLLNAAYRDGSDAQPYPAWLGLALRFAMPLTVLVSLTALYSLAVRTGQYGLTVERVWAFVVAGSALLHSAGYSGAALGGQRWLAGMARVNVAGALALMAVLVLMLTPVLSPYRLAAASQYAAALRPPPATADDERQDGPIAYLRFGAGGYGTARLKALARLTGHPDAARLRKEAAAALAARDRGDPVLARADWQAALDTLAIFPAGRDLEPGLRAAIEARAGERARRHELETWRPGEGGGVYLDLNGDGTDEFALLFPGAGQVYARSDAGWRLVGTLPTFGVRDWDRVLADLQAGRVGASAPPWNDLRVGETRLRILVQEEAGTRSGEQPALAPGVGR